MKTILFQGDSITDCGRNKEKFDDLGNGYPLSVKVKIGCEMPNQYVFYNRGINGERIKDLYSRIKQDIIDLKPDYMSILIGANDVLWNEFRDGYNSDEFERIYCELIEEVKEAVPGIEIVLLEPFCLRGSLTEDTEKVADKYQRFSLRVREFAKSVKKVADKYNLTFIPLQHLFDEAAQKAEDTYWLRDGIHPTIMGNEIISRQWIKFFNDRSEKQ